jgi:hypothetical protein
MADEPQPVDGDPFGKELEESIRSNAALLQGLQYQYGQKMLESQQGSGDPPSPFELAALKKLELQIQNDKVFAQARALTRRRAQQRDAE